MAGTDEAEIRRRLGTNVRRLRRARGLTQEELAEQAGLPTTTVAKVEREELNATLWVLVALAVALDVTPGDLVAGHGKRPDPPG